MTKFRLSPDIIPLDYDIFVRPNIPAKTYSGTVAITFKEIKKSSYVELWTHESIKIKSITQNNSPLEYSISDDLLQIKGEHLCESPVTIEIDGSIDQTNVGFYYVNDECASTQFESTHCRKFIPCFDEPSVKSTFKITVITPLKLIAMSNMPVESLQYFEDHKQFSFQRSPPMCSYLLALVIGLFDLKSGFTKRGLPVDCYAPVGKYEYLDFPLQEAIKGLDWLEDYIGVPFPLPRMQLVCVPEFNLGAMENYGLIIGRENCMIGIVGKTSDLRLFFCGTTVVHELCHQWCGNSVSPSWWDSIWLNEGFATVLPYYCYEDIHPEKDPWSRFLVDDITSALALDAASTTHPIHCNVETADQIESVFDDIVYAKAGSVIRMFISYFGREKIHEVFKTYFSRFANKCVETSDLCDVFTEVLNYDMKPLMDAWAKQSGYPIVILEEDNTLHQKRFTNSGLVEDRTWPIPLSVLYENGEEKKFILGPEPIKLDIPENSWVKLNHDYASFCRTWHKGKHLQRLIKAIEEKKLSKFDRFGILIDTYALAKIGEISYGEILTLIKSFVNESEEVVARSLFGIVNTIYRIFTDFRPQLKEIGLAVHRGLLNSIGREKRPNEPSVVAQLRTQLVNSLAFRYEEQESIDFGVSLFNHYKVHHELPPGVDPSFASLALYCGSMFADDGLDFIWKLIKETNNPEIKTMAIMALGFTKKEKIEESMSKVFTDIPLQDVPIMFRGVAVNPREGGKYWQCLKNNWDALNKAFGGQSFTLPAIIEDVDCLLHTEEEAAEIEQFFIGKTDEITKDTVARVIENIRLTASIVKRENESVRQALSQ